MAFFILFPILFVMDYVLTYIGIANNIITEANPFMVWLFEIPFLYGLMLRIFMGVIFISILWIGRKTRIFKIGSKIIIAANSFIFLLHFIWIYFYFLCK